MANAYQYHFHKTAEDIRLEGWTLWAKLRRLDGSWNVAQLRLNHVLGNDNGKFAWDGEKVSDSAKDPTLVFWEGYPIVRASLQDYDGNFQQADYNLSDTIGNSDGNFVFTHKGRHLTTHHDPDIFICDGRKYTPSHEPWAREVNDFAYEANY